MEIDNSSTYPSSDVHGTQNCHTKLFAMLHHDNIKIHRTPPGPTDPMLSKHTNRIERHQAHNFEASKGHQHRPSFQGHQPGTQIRNRCTRSCIKKRLGGPSKTATAGRLAWHTRLKSMCTHAHFPHAIRRRRSGDQKGGSTHQGDPLL